MKNFLVAALIGCASVAAVAADTQESYVSGFVGRSEYKFDGEREHHTGFGVAFGQSLSEFTGYEVGYAHLGSFDQADGSGHSLYLAGLAKYSVNNEFSVYGKIGPTVNYASGEDSETRVRLLLGAGVSYKFDQNWAATLEYNHFGKTLDVKPSLWSVGLRYYY